MTTTGYRFTALWPIVDPTVPWDTLLDEAQATLPLITARARATLTGPGTWYVAPASRVPGSGNTTGYVLVHEAPATKTPARPYHRPQQRIA